MGKRPRPASIKKAREDSPNRGNTFAKFWKYVGVGYLLKAAKDEVRVELEYREQ